MLSREAAPTRPGRGERAGAEHEAGPWWRAALLFGGVAALLWAVAWVSLAHLPQSTTYPGERFFPHQPWVGGWARWDSGWYNHIADRGYFFDEAGQSPVAFFPAYPLAMRLLGAVVGSSLVAGILLTMAAGLAVAEAAWTWIGERLSTRAAWTALGLLLLYPYAYYLYGVVYADALFVAAGLAAFLLLERDHPWLAGLAGAVATAARPIGVVVVAGLVVRALERRGVFPRGRPDGGIDRDAVPLPGGAGDAPASRPLVDLRRLRWGDAGVLLSIGGLVAYCVYLGVRFGDPLAFASAERFWGQGAGLRTWFKLDFVENVTDVGDPTAWLAYVAHPVVTVAALALVPRVFRRFGWGYGVYSLLVVGLAAFSTKDFFGMGRYVLAAFPCFGVAGELVAERLRPRARTWVLGASGVGLVVLTSFFARGSYLS